MVPSNDTAATAPIPNSHSMITLVFSAPMRWSQSLTRSRLNNARPSIAATNPTLINRIKANPDHNGVGHSWPVSTRTLISPVNTNPATSA